MVDAAFPELFRNDDLSLPRWCCVSVIDRTDQINHGNRWKLASCEHQVLELRNYGISSKWRGPESNPRDEEAVSESCFETGRAGHLPAVTVVLEFGSYCDEIIENHREKPGESAIVTWCTVLLLLTRLMTCSRKSYLEFRARNDQPEHAQTKTDGSVAGSAPGRHQRENVHEESESLKRVTVTALLFVIPN